ncbi:MAG: pcnB [Gammaproteobacteria bacterium]|nr:pcnB [Gammaproteobacteria bacterium]
MLKNFVTAITKTKTPVKNKLEPLIIPRAEHTISRSAISRNALKVLYRLHEAGFNAYLVGGCVRDLLLGHTPKDFDIGTNARPEEIRNLFKNCRLIGKRFRLAHILFGHDVIEVATFRTHHENAQEGQGKSHQGMIVRDNVYGTIEDDAIRRDFRINALYYNIADYSIVDFVGGMQDIKEKALHMIGDPTKRFLEDPVRLLRAVRFLAKLNIHITPETEEPLMKLSHLLDQVSPARLYQEILKIFQSGAMLSTMNLLQKYHLISKLFIYSNASKTLLNAALVNADQRVREGKTVSPAFLFAVILWKPISEQVIHLESEGMSAYIAVEKSIQHIIKQQTERLTIPRVMQFSIREICLLQHRFYRRGRESHLLLEHPRFRAGYDLLLLRAQTEEPVQELAEWWKQFHSATYDQREKMLKEIHRTVNAKKKSRRRRKKRKNHRIPINSNNSLFK